MPKRKCKHCNKWSAKFIELPAGTFFNMDHAMIWVRQQEAKAQKKRAAKAKADRADLRKRKEALLTVSDWIKKVQPVFNKFIRLRDRHQDCISCGRDNIEVESTDGWKPGGAWDCGHFLWFFGCGRIVGCSGFWFFEGEVMVVVHVFVCVKDGCVAGMRCGRLRG